MANVQSQLESFNQQIMLKRFDENAVLREKRNIIRDKLEARLPEVFEQHEEECLKYYWRDQGSYEMGTGIKPIEGDYDIDQGLYFETSTDTYPDPVVLKQRIHEALDGHTKRVEIRRPCVTVFYQLDGESIYHVDIAVYSDGANNPDGKSRIAKGKLHSVKEYRVWEVSDPQALRDCIFNRFEGNDRDQFRRIVRYLKRWKDVNFDRDGNAAPLGIGLTVAAYEFLVTSYFDVFAGKPDDLTALRGLIGSILNHFTSVWDEEEKKFVRRLVINLPTEPYNDLFEQMPNKQISDLESQFQSLRDVVKSASDETDPVDACKALAVVFGDDFPVPTKQETAKRHGPAIASSSSSA